MNTRKTLTIAAALLTAAMFAPAPAFAAEAPTLAELTSQATSATADVEKVTTDLSKLEAKLAAARDELAKIESRLPSTPREELRAVATAVGAAFSPSLAERAEATAADMRQRDQLQTDIDRMKAERAELVAEAEEKRDEAASVQKLLAKAQTEADAQAAAQAAAAAAEAERVRTELAPQVRLMIDPGHGGSDPGAVGFGVAEKDTNMQISWKVVEAANRQGWNVNITRASDSFVPLPARPAVANAWGATALVSIHSNSYGPTPKGNMTIYRDAGGAALGQQIMEEMDPLTPYGDIGNRSDVRGLAVLRGAAMPAVIVEVLSLSAGEEVQALVNNEVQWQYAEAIVKGVADFHGIPYVPPHTPAAAPAPAPAPEQAPDGTVAEQPAVTPSAEQSKVEASDTGAGSKDAAKSGGILNELFRLLVG